MSRTPTLTEVILAAIESRLVDVHTSIPGKVVRYDAAKQLVDVAPQIKTRHTDEDGAAVVEALPVVTNVPVVFPGSGGFSITFPVQVGDVVWLSISEASLDKWKSQGGEVDPLDPRRHHLSDAVALVGLRPFSDPLPSTETGVVTIGSNTGTPQFAALANLVKAELDAIYGHLNSHIHATPAGPSTTVTLIPPATTAGPVASATVKIKG